MALAPDDAGLRRGFAAHLLEAGDPDAARAALDPGDDSAAAWHLRGLAEAELAAFPAAIAAFRQTVARDPEPGRRLVQPRHDAADRDAVCGRAGGARPGGGTGAGGPADPRQPRGGPPACRPLHRGLGRVPNGACACRAIRRCRWRGCCPTWRRRATWRGRTVLLTHEEGFGDTLQFVRYAPLLAARGARVLLAVPRPLARLLAPLAPVVPADGPLPEHDFHCPFFSLPRAFGTTPETIPAVTSYLAADPTLAAAWAARLPPRDGARGLRVGLVWAGQARPWLAGFATLDRRRSASLADFAPLAGLAGVTFVSLQAGPPAAEAARPPPEMTLFDPMAEVADFADTAAIVAGLDLVISVDTAVVHLAGALGKPVFLLDRYDNCWRWLSGRDDSPWYPRLRIFRQERPGDWTGPMRRVAAGLREYAAAGFA